MFNQNDHLGVYLKQIFCVKRKAVSMKSWLLCLLQLLF